ncbi:MULTISPECIES: M23 family metallopeptidase [unclassified Corynebacterium]|uniref:M23 family metallopeptidase n=1 Tax=unclassified Corynebacterium TaxID=2624378 RepID=UPI001FED67E7|nr:MULTISPECIES: M23 family metallopeptidase [unclassified Corynebacterium]
MTVNIASQQLPHAQPQRRKNRLWLVLCLSLSMLLGLFPFPAPSRATSTTPLERNYISPITATADPGKITHGFDPPKKKWLAGHRGVDLAATVGQDIYAAQDGVIAFVGIVAGTPVLSIDHNDGIRTTYQPIDVTNPDISQGTVIQAGQVIGKLSPVGISHGQGLHWGARTGKDTYINPLSLLGAPVIRLKPLSNQ